MILHAMIPMWYHCNVSLLLRGEENRCLQYPNLKKLFMFSYISGLMQKGCIPFITFTIIIIIIIIIIYYFF